MLTKRHKRKSIEDISSNDFSDKELEQAVDAADRETEKLEERAPLTLQQRLKRARVFRRISHRLQRGRRIKKYRMAPRERLEYRARKAAKMAVRKKYAGKKGANYHNLSHAEKITVDRLIANKGALIEKLAKRMLPIVRKKEIERLKKARQKTNEEFQMKTFQEMFGENVHTMRVKDQIQKERDRDKIRHQRAINRARLTDMKIKTRKRHASRKLLG